MALDKQWVNLTVSDKWKGEGITDRKQMGLNVSLQFRFRKKKRATVYVTKEADGGNASYTPAEKRRRDGFRPRVFARRRYRTDRHGVATVRTSLTLAGGDKFTFSAEDRSGTKVELNPRVTRRKLYFQLIAMAGLVPQSLASLQSEFWNTGDQIYVKMVEFSPGRTIPLRENFDSSDATVVAAVQQEARRQYDKSKKPYAFVIVLAKKTARSGVENNIDPATFTGPTYPFSTNGVLFDFVDPGVDYYISLSWQPLAGGAPLPLARNRLARAGQKQITIDTTGLPPNVPGQLTWEFRVLAGTPVGMSYRDNNFTMVATQSWNGTPKTPHQIALITNHEVGHKVGMVPGAQGNRALDPQPLYYHGKGHVGPHCGHGVATLAAVATFQAAGAPVGDCVMFGSIASNRSDFCENCRLSLRKLDLRSRTNVGIRTQF